MPEPLPPDPDGVEEEARAPFDLEALQRSLDGFRAQLSAMGIDVSESEPSETDPRFYAIRNAALWDLEEAERLVKDDPEIVHARNGLGETALHFLAVENELEAVQWLYEHGADLNTRGKYGDTPLFEAAGLGYTDLCRWLLEQGLDPTVTVRMGRTALDEAAGRGRAETLAMLLEWVGPEEARNGYFTEFNESDALDEHPEVERLLIERGLIDGGFRSLRRAACDDLQEAERLIREAPESLHLRNGRGETLLSSLTALGRLEAVQMLHGLGAELDPQDGDGRTPLMKAATGGHLELCRWLLEQGANPTIKDPDGDTALAFAARYDQRETVCLLLDVVGPEEELDAYFSAGSVWEIHHGTPEIAQLLIGRGLSADQDEDGQS